MRFSSFALYVAVGGTGIIATAICADHHVLNAGPIYAIGLTTTLLLFPLVFLARRRWDRARYGTKIVVNLEHYKAPAICPETGGPAVEARVAQFTMTGGVVSLRGGFPVLLSAEGASSFDRRFFKAVRGLRVVGASSTNITLYVKDETYLSAMREANRDTGAVGA